VVVAVAASVSVGDGVTGVVGVRAIAWVIFASTVWYAWVTSIDTSVDSLSEAPQLVSIPATHKAKKLTSKEYEILNFTMIFLYGDGDKPKPEYLIPGLFLAEWFLSGVKDHAG
jgi:hypothetical protein